MKKGLMLLLLAVCFANFSFGLVRIKPYIAENRNTKIANLVNYVVRYNGVEKPNLIHAGETYYFPTIKRDTYGEPYFLLEVYDKDHFWKMSEHYIFGDPRYPYVENSLPVVQPAPDPKPVIPETKNSGFDWFWPFIWVLVLLLASLFYSSFRSFKNKEEKMKIAEGNRRTQRELERELEVTKKKLPVVPPVLSNERWLRENSPVELMAPSFDSPGNPTPTASTVARVFGTTPDLIAYALVSTKESAVNMEFSNERHANTGLSKVAVWLGWNWDIEESKWVEVGMIASVCANGFVMNPEKVKKTDLLFTSVELVNKTKHPVLSCSEKVPEGTLYPELVSKLVVKYHENDIADLRKAGATVALPETKKEAK